MKKVLITLAVVLALVATVVFVAPAYAQEGAPPMYPRGGNGRGGNGSAGTGLYADPVNLDGALDDLVQASLAETLGLTLAELAAREDAGETFVSIALALGYSIDEAQDMQTQARLDALEQGVIDGLLTQEQADWMTSRWDGTAMYGNGNGNNANMQPSDDTATRSYSNSQSGRGGRFGR
ncbi:MAG: hypothetical protein JXB38_22230 [Anaerolineales bacterium]|nr:hypothetical protein [Anaerolineales bacterium]